MDPLAVGSAAAVLAAIVAGLGARRVARNRPAKRLDPGDRAVIDTIVALGYDPTKILFQLVQGKKAGIRILTKDGRPLRFWRASEIKRKQHDPEFRKRFALARQM